MTNLTDEDLFDFYARGLHVVKDDGGDPVTVAEKFGQRGVTAIVDIGEIVGALADMAGAEAGKQRKKAEKGIRRAIHRGHQHRTGQLLDEDSLERKGRLNDAVESRLIYEEAREIAKRNRREMLDPSRGIRESMMTHEQLRAEPKLPDLIEGVLPQSSLATVVGSSGVGKTFLGLSVSSAIAMRQPWMGRPTAGGPVLYLLAEGGGGVAKRLDALSDGFYGGRAIEDLLVIRRPFDMTDTTGEVVELRELVAEIDPAAIFWDTLIRHAGGAEENSATGMSLVLGNMEWVCRAGTRTTGVAVHHTGHEGTRARGTSAIYANVDTELTLSGEPSALTLKATKQKDGRQGLIGEFRLKESPHHESIVFEGVAPGQGTPSGEQAARIAEALSHFDRAFGVTGATRPAFVKSLTEWMDVSEASAHRYVGDLIRAGRLTATKGARSTLLALPTTVTFPKDPEPTKKNKKEKNP